MSMCYMYAVGLPTSIAT